VSATPATTCIEGFAALPVPASGLDLDLTLQSGQVFHWQREGAGWVGALGDAPVYLEVDGGEVRVPAGMEADLGWYLALDHDLEVIAATFPKDSAMEEALRFSAGMRILRQPVWECLATFITSSMKQVSHIAQMSHAIRRRFGRRLDWAGREVYAYPGAERLAGVREAELRECGLGYRAANLLKTAQRVAGGHADLEGYARLGDEDLRKVLCDLPGVGEKVANCVLLFGYGRLGAVPVDVWIGRILREVYFKGKRAPTAARMKQFAATYFGPYAGYAQQYLFHHARQTWRRGRAQTKSGGKASLEKGGRKVQGPAPIGGGGKR
jgi:N-glycosylase/DNA lyase